MTFKDWTQSIWDKVRSGGAFGQGEGVESNMANGGFSGYKPATAKHRPMGATQQQSMPQGADPMAGMTGMNWEQPAPQSTGFTGMYPQGMGYQPAMNNAAPFQQPAMQPTGMQPPMGGYQQPPMNTPVPPMGTAMWPEQTGYMDNHPMGATGFGAAPGAFQGGGYNQGMGGGQTSRFQAPEAAPQDNIRYMPGSFVGDDGKAYSHVERVAQVSSVSGCYRVIEFMRNSESVIVNTEMISDEAEIQRCLDLLYGAAFAMKCSLTRVARRSVYLIAPATVMVVPYDGIRRISDQDMNTRWPEADGESKWDRAFRGDRGYGSARQGYQSGREGRNDPYAGRPAYQDDFTGRYAAGFGR